MRKRTSEARVEGVQPDGRWTKLTELDKLTEIGVFDLQN